MADAEHRPTTTGDDRRRAPRVALETSVDFQSDSNFFTGFSADLSEGGLFVATYALLEPGTRLTIRFELPCGHQVDTLGEVRWVRDPLYGDDDTTTPGMGIRFEQLATEDERAIHAFISQREALFYVE